MSKVILHIERDIHSERSIIGRLGVVWPFGENPNIPFLCYTLELPWEDNRKFRSCIPPNTLRYRAHVTTHPKLGWVVAIEGTRPGVMIHKGNLPKATTGCILVGMDHSLDWVGDSKKAITNLRQELEKSEDPLDLFIEICDRMHPMGRQLWSNKEGVQS
jgi:hypothetical protein